MAVFKYKDPETNEWKVMGYMNEGGSGGGLLPQIIVTADSGSTVTCSKGDVVLTADEVDGTWTFNVPEFGEWLLFVNGLIVEVFHVDTVRQYFSGSGQIMNYTMLYDYGDECTDITGGWTTNGYTSGVGSLSPATKNEDNIFTCGPTSPSDQHRMLGTNLAVNTTGYNAIFAFAKNVSTDNSSYWPWLRVNVGAKGDIFSSISTGNPAIHANLNASGTVWAFSNTLAVGGTTSAKTWVQHSDFDNRNIYVAIASTWINTRKANWYAIFITKEDDWYGLCNIANVTLPDTVLSLVTNSNKIASILASDVAVRYMVNRCTGDFMAHAIQSSAFLTALEESPYKELVYANEHWAKFLAMVA